MNSITQVTSDLSTLAQGDDWSNVEKICGERASNLCQLQYLGFDIPKGIVITTNAYRQFVESGDKYALSDDLFENIYKGILQLETLTKKQYGTDSLLLLSVSGNFPIPSTICVGLNDYLVQVLEKSTNNPIFAYDSYRRLIASYGVVACGIPEAEFDDIFYKYKCSRNYHSLSDFKAPDFVQLVKMNKAIITKFAKKQFPQDPIEQLRNIILGIYLYYENENLVAYYKNTFTPINGCSILINAMVYGSKSTKSCSLVVCTNDISGGDYGLCGSYGIASYLDDVCEGRKETKSFTEFKSDFHRQHKLINSKLDAILKCYKRPMEIKFVIENGRMYAVGIKDMMFGGYGNITATNELIQTNILSEESAINHFKPYTLASLMNSHLASLPEEKFCSGSGSANGAGTGRLSLSIHDLGRKKNSILMKRNVFISELTYLLKAKGIITTEGSDFSRGAYIARALSIPGAFACKSLLIEEDRHVASTPEQAINEGKSITVDFGDVFTGNLETTQLESISNSDANTLYKSVLNIARNKYKIYMNATDVESIKKANNFGADGIGLFKLDQLFTQHQDNFVEAVQNNSELPEEVVQSIKDELIKVFQNADKLPISLQLFDLPLNKAYQSSETIEEELHELVPKQHEYDRIHAILDAKKQAKKSNEEEEDNNENPPQNQSKQQAQQPEEQNDEEVLDLPPPEEEARLREKVYKLDNIMNTDLHAIHLSYIFPQVYTIQVKLIMEAAKSAKDAGAEPKPKIVIPFSHEEKDMMRLLSYINSLSRETGFRADFGCIGLSPANIANASKVAKFILINPQNIFKSGDAPFYRNTTLRYKPSIVPHELLDECFNSAKKKKKSVPIVLMNENFMTKEAINDLAKYRIKSISTNPDNLMIARFCAAQTLVSDQPSNEEEPQEE
ncbi:hypothetical protein TRFO_07086 [Tritrichomonas foetus]|uniref:pyruvate, phosphate dikinase n=1 Tax=Tritrichomonas foetus TaxID=1144522 RepID=A0A1J4JVA3_9EUKA|nr:hypothetical protein TRFO_07086 [Tritrichomonas foetus]|eukprot:OHT02650.1 hypothetical protein TRFO_07086 [Tritrichomonas foetus]